MDYAHTQSPQIGALFAEALFIGGDAATAQRIATELLAGERRPDALTTLGKIAIAQEHFVDAHRWLTQARYEHFARGELGRAARDAQLLGQLASALGDEVTALAMIDIGLAEAARAGDRASQFLGHLDAVSVLVDVGHFEAAKRELVAAAPLATSLHERQQLEMETGNVEQEIDRALLAAPHQEVAISHFRNAQRFAEQRRAPQELRYIHLNLAYSLAEQGEAVQAREHLAAARELDPRNELVLEYAQLEARIAFRVHELSRAAQINDRVYSSIANHDDALDVCVMQGRIAMAHGSYAASVQWALHGVEHAAAVVNGSRALRPWLAASRRSPYELWFVALARGGRHAEAVQVFDRLQALGLLDDLHGGTPAQTLAESTAQLRELERWIPSTSQAPLVREVAPIVEAATPGVDVLGLVVAEGDVWRIVATGGRLYFDDLGPFEALRPLLRKFSGAAGEIEIANQLGAQLLPASVARTSTAPLYVVLDAAFEGLPVSALARDDQRLAALRPVIRAPRWPRPTACRALDIRAVRALADPHNNLAAAAKEARSVAMRFDEAPLVGRSATSEALLTAQAGSLLHVGLHAQTSMGSQLRLFDRNVSAAEISTMKRAPALVVLAACESARTSDPALNDALATAFLAAGARYVVATLRPIGDDQAYEVTHNFYAADGAHEPAKALAKVQADLAHSRSNQAWWSFAVFSNEACLPR